MRRSVLIALLAIVVLVTLVKITVGAADNPRAPRVCISAVGPVDQYENGDTTPELAGDCP